MPKTIFTSSRRAFLHTSSACIALPFLESLRGSPATAEDSVKPAPKRMVFLGMGFGVTAEAWYPDIKVSGYDYELSESLNPLARHQKDITILQNLEHANSKDGHAGSTFWLTGADRYAIPGQNFHNTISVDQVAAEQFGKETRYSSMTLETEDGYAGHGPGSISWNRQGKPIMGLPNPAAFYHKLFSASSLPLEQRQALLADDRSALDTVLADARSVKKGLTKTDVEKVDEYFQSIREIEVRLTKEEKWLTVPKKSPDDPVRQPPESLEGVPEVEMMYDLMLAAMQVDASRVFSYRLPGDSFVASLGSSYTVHNLSHYGGSPARTEDSKLRDRKHAELIAKFIDKLKLSTEPDGSSLYDNVTLAFGSNLRVTHSLNNCPTLITGGGSGFKHGRHMVMEKKTPLCNLWLSMLHGSGVKVDSFGDSTRVIKDLYEA